MSRGTKFRRLESLRDSINECTINKAMLARFTRELHVCLVYMIDVGCELPSLQYIFFSFLTVPTFPFLYSVLEHQCPPSDLVLFHSFLS